jgi:putative membrane protein
LNYSALPAVNATLNSASFVLLLAGFLLIRRRKIRLHRICMLAALSTSALFLLSYVVYHLHVGHVRFGGAGAVRGLYLAILGTHSILAAAIVPLALVTVSRALRGRFERHRAIARWTLPIWLYVSVTGVVVYLMLYHLYPPRVAAVGLP